MPTYAPGSSTVRALTPGLEQFFFRRTSSAADAEELVQETWAASVNYRGESSMRHYLYSIAIRLVAGWHRQRYRRPCTLFDDLEATCDIDAFMNQMTSLGSKLQKADELRLLHDAIEALRDPYRETMKLHLKGLNSIDIARRLGVSSNTIRSRLARARTALRGTFEDER